MFYKNLNLDIKLKVKKSKTNNPLENNPIHYFSNASIKKIIKKELFYYLPFLCKHNIKYCNKYKKKI